MVDLAFDAVLGAMSLEAWAAFALASTIVLMIPGPTILLVCAYALSSGRASALAVVSGVALGDLVAMSLSVAGLGALMAASSTLFTVLKWLGALYLIYLGVRMWRSADAASAEPETAGVPARRAALQAFAVTATNPKSIVFFIAFVPQFVDPSRAVAPQLVLMTATFVALAAANAALYSVAAAQLRGRLTGPAARAWLARLGGGALVALGCATALARRA